MTAVQPNPPPEHPFMARLRAMVANLPPVGFKPFAVVDAGGDRYSVLAVVEAMLDPAVDPVARRRVTDEFKAPLAKAGAVGVAVVTEAWLVEGGVSVLLGDVPGVPRREVSGAVLVLVEHTDVRGGAFAAYRCERGAALAPVTDTSWTSGLGGWLPSADVWGAQ